MGKMLNNDTNYRIVAGEDLVVQPVGIRSTDGKVYAFKSGVETDTYIGWTVQSVAAGEVAGVIRSGKVGQVETNLTPGTLVAVGSTGALKAAVAGDVIVGVIPFGGTTGLEPVQVFILDGVVPTA